MAAVQARIVGAIVDADAAIGPGEAFGANALVANRKQLLTQAIIFARYRIAIVDLQLACVASEAGQTKTCIIFFLLFLESEIL